MSGAASGDIRRSVARGRETLGAMLSAAQTHLQKVAVVFLVAFLGTFYALWLYVWEQLKEDLFSQLPPKVAEQTSVRAITPFDVPLLQVKVALIVGALVSLPVLLYYSRGALKERGYWPQLGYGRATTASVVLLAVLLFIGGVAYAYTFLFPLLFQFLASNAVAVGFKPAYSIVEWAQFVLIISLAMGVAAQLPLVMTATVLGGVVNRETYREKWRHAIVIIAFVASVINGSPDPFSMALVAVPMMLLYGVGYICATVAVGAASLSPGALLRERWKRIVGFPLVVAGIVRAAIVAGFGGYFNQVIVPQIPYFTPEEPVFKYIGPMLGLPRHLAIAVVAAGTFLGLFVLVFAYYAYTAASDAAGGGTTEDPATLDIEILDEAGVRAAPVETFATMSEQEATAQASMAMSDGNPDKAQAILDRFDAAQGTDVEDELPGGFEPAVEDETVAEPETDEPASEAGSAETDVQATFRQTTADIVDVFTTEETTEDDIGGYYYDLTFVLSTLRSRSFRLIGLFVIVLAGSFSLLARGGLGVLWEDFLANLPSTVRPEQVDVVALHPVEVLIFAIKLSTLFAALAVLPFLLYYAWPVLRERGLTGGDRRLLFVWGGALVASLIGGIILGYTIVAPTVISWLAADIIGANMVVAFRISSAGWLVFFTTAGIGLLAMIPVTMVLFHRGRLVPFRSMQNRWREVTVAVFALTAYASPRGVFMMFILGIPIMFCYGLGLGLLWIYTLGGRRTPSGTDQRESAD
jgi:sec-independent protein translocase protein TatC